MCRSKRPGLIKAGSRMSARFVPANTTILVLLLNPLRQKHHRLFASGKQKQPEANNKVLPTIHFYKQLIQSVFLFTLNPRASPSADCINLINEKDTGGNAARFDKQIPYLIQRNACVINTSRYHHVRFRIVRFSTNPCRAHAHKHFQELRAVDRDEGNVNLSGSGLCEQRLSSSRWT